MAGIDLNSIIRDLGTLSNVQREQTQQIAGQRAAQGEIAEQIANNLLEVAERQERVENQALEAALEAQNQSRRVARVAGMDASASNEILSHMMGGMRTDVLAHDAASRQAQAMDEQGNLLANPLGWLNNVLNGPEVRATRDATAERLAQSQAQLNNMHSLTQANVQTQNAIAETMTASTIKDQARANALLAESKALEAESNAKEFTIAGWETLRNFGSEEFNRRFQVGNAVRQQQNHEQSMAMREQELNTRRKALEMEMDAMKSWEHLTDLGNEARERLGLKGPELTPAMVRQHWGQPTQIGQYIMSAVDSGYMASETGTNMIGRDAASTFQIMQLYGGQMPANADEHLVAAFDTAARILEEERDAARLSRPGVQPTAHGFTVDTVDDMAIYNRGFNSIVESELRKLDTNFDEYKINTAHVTQNDPALAESEFYSQVVEPLTATDAGYSIREAASITAEKFATGELNINEATEGLRRLWQGQRDVFNATNGRLEMGLPSFIDESAPRLLVGQKFSSVGSIGAQTGLMSFDLDRGRDLKTQDIWERVDLTDSNAVTQYLINYKNNKLARQMQESANQ